MNMIGDYIVGLAGGTVPEVELIGGKAWSIARMTALGLRVPPAFVITTKACAQVLEQGELPFGLEAGIDDAVAWLERSTSRSFGSGEHPLLVSVRSGAPISMPGMMDTILNLGISERTEEKLARECGDLEFARDTHKRFLEQYSSIVLKAPVDLERDGKPSDWIAIIEDAAAGSVPKSPREQLNGAIEAVFRSWNSRRARRYRDHHGISHDIGTAVTVQAMVFGNMDDRSGTGVLFSRNPLTGEPAPYGEFMQRAQGEDVVSGRHTPSPISKLKDLAPEVHDELLQAAEMLENEAGDVQDVEFTVERGTLYLLQTRAAKRAPAAALRIAHDMVREGKISPDEALQRVSSEQVRSLLSPRISSGAVEGAILLAQGDPASPGVGSGVVVTTSDDAENRANNGEAVVLMRRTTSPDDLHGMLAARAIITERGGSTSHAAVVGRALGRPCVVGCGDDCLVGLAGQQVTVDGSTGKVFAGELAVEHPSVEANEDLKAFAEWAAERTPVTITSESSLDLVYDLDPYSENVAARLKSLPRGAAVKGAVFATSDDAVRSAIAAGVSTIVTRPTLPALIISAQSVLASSRKEPM